MVIAKRGETTMTGRGTEETTMTSQTSATTITTARVMDYQTGARLSGAPSAELVEASIREGRDTGAIAAYCEDGVWQYVAESERSQVREEVRIVWLEGVPETAMYWSAGDRVQAGDEGSDDHDTGVVQSVRRSAEGHEIVTVGWDSSVSTDVDVDGGDIALVGR